MSSTIEAGKQEATQPRRPKRKLVDADELMGAREVADELGIRVQNLQFVKDLPEAVSHVAATRLWDGRVIRKFAEREARRREARRTEKAA